MMNLTEYRKRPNCLADYLPWSALIAPGVVLNKDGSFQRTAKFRGPDLESCTEEELVATCARINNALRRFSSGWALYFEAARYEPMNTRNLNLPMQQHGLLIKSAAGNLTKIQNSLRASIIYNTFGETAGCHDFL